MFYIIFLAIISDGRAAVQLLQCLNLHHNMKVQSEVEVQRHSFFTSALDGVVYSTSRSGRLTTREEPR